MYIVHGFLQTMYDVTEGSGLDTMFQLNVKGTTEFNGDLVISGSITAASDGTASKSLIHAWVYCVLLSASIAESDFVELQPVSVINSAVVNPRRACAARVTVVVLCVCVCVCVCVCLSPLILALQAPNRLMSDNNGSSATSARKIMWRFR